MILAKSVLKHGWNIIHQTIKATEIHRVDVKVSAKISTVTYMHQSQPSLHLLLINLKMHLEF